MSSRWSISQAVSVVALPLLALGPITTSFELWLRFLPERLPAIQYLHGTSTLGLSLWFLSFPLNALSLYCQFRAGTLVKLVVISTFSACYVSGSMLVWRHFTWGCWVAVGFLAIALADAAFRRRP
jgi:hypothetical protein